MPRIDRATFSNALSLLLVLSFAAARTVCADELTGTPHDDPKDLIPPSLACTSGPVMTDSLFQPLPYWSHHASMPALPDALRPMGKKVVVMTTPPVAAPQPLAPPKDAPTAQVAKPKVVVPMPNPAPAPTPAMISVSPFLQWIKSNPQAAAEQARQQAGVTQAPAADQNAPTPLVTTPGAPAPTAGTPTGPVETPYWMPPLIDAPQFGPSSNGGSAAIYSTPQR